MGWLYQLFFPAHTPTENELEMGRYRIIAEGAVAGVIYAVATGNFLAGYLSSPWGVRILMRRSGHDTVFRVRTAVFLALCV